MKKLSINLFLFLIFLLLSLPGSVQASPPQQELVERQLEKLGIEEITQYWEEITTVYGGFLPESQKGSLLEFVSGDKKFSIKEWLLGFLKYLFYELLANGKLLSTLIMLTIFSMFLQTLQNSFEKSAVSKVAYALVLWS